MMYTLIEDLITYFLNYTKFELGNKLRNKFKYFVVDRDI